MDAGRTRDRPDDDEPDRDGPRDGGTDAGLVRVHVEVAPNHVVRRDTDARRLDAVRHVVREDLRGHVRGDLLVEEHERRVQRLVRLRRRGVRLERVRVVRLRLREVRRVRDVARERAPRLLQRVVRLLDLLARPLDRVHLLAHEREPERQEAERRKAVGGALVLGHELLSERDVALLDVDDAGIRERAAVGGGGVNGSALVLLRGFCLRLHLLVVKFDGGVEEVRLRRLELLCGLQAAFVQVRHLFQITVQPDLGNAAGKVREEVRERGFGEIAAGDTGDEHRARLRGRHVLRLDEPFLARRDEVLHLVADVPPDPDGKKPREDDVRRIAALLVGRNVAKDEAVKTGVRSDGCADGSGGE